MKLLPHPKNPSNYSGFQSSAWINADINDSMISSYRDDALDRSTFLSSLHFHDYYEVVVIIGGEIRYVCENVTVKPRHCDIIVIPPGKFHMSIIDTDETQYIRQVFYFYPNAFSSYQCSRLLDFLKDVGSDNFCFSLSAGNREKLLHLIAETRDIVQQDTGSNHPIILANILQIFFLFNQPAKTHLEPDEYFPAALMEIQNYIDHHFTEIDTMTDIASHLFYTREYMARLFKKYKKITITEYIIKRRISYSCQLMQTDMSLADICFYVGFGSVSAFIRAFKNETGIPPSQYRKKLHAGTERA